MLSSNNLLLPALIFVAAGFLVGILVMTLISERAKRRDKVPPLNPEMDDLVVPAAPVLPESRFTSIAHIYREKTSGKIVTDVNGKVHLTHNTIPPEQLSSLQESSRNWQYWLGMSEPAPTLKPIRPPESVPAVEPPKPTTAAPLAAETPAAPIPPETPEAAAGPAVVPVSTPAAVEPAPIPVPTPAAANNAAPRPVVVDKPRATTMVGQIEDILQEMIPQTKYAGQEIHLTEDPTNGVIVWVGALKFTGINSVSDEGVKNLIQAAVRRWEDSGGAI